MPTPLRRVLIVSQAPAIFGSWIGGGICEDVRAIVTVARAIVGAVVCVIPRPCRVAVVAPALVQTVVPVAPSWAVVMPRTRHTGEATGFPATKAAAGEAGAT